MPSPPFVRASLRFFACIWILLPATARAQRLSDFTAPTPLPAGEVLIVGIQGGRERWNNPTAVRRLALKVRAMSLPGVHVETVENGKRRLALDLIRNAVDTNQDGTLDAEERARVQLILYGQSFGGAAVVKLAQELHELGLPVLLTVQIDSVGRGDAVIPSNVRRAANLFQADGWLIRGEPAIRAADPSQTAILGNLRYSYRNKKIDISQVSWLKKIFRIAHTKMEYDPEVWGKVEELILEEVRRAGAKGFAGAHRCNPFDTGGQKRDDGGGLLKRQRVAGIAPGF